MHIDMFVFLFFADSTIDMYIENMSLTFEMDDIPAYDEKAEKDCQT